MLSELCMDSANAEIQLWWSLDLNWGDRPDSSVTAGKSESEISDLKAAAAKEVIRVTDVVPEGAAPKPVKGRCQRRRFIQCQRRSSVPEVAFVCFGRTAFRFSVRNTSLASIAPGAVFLC